MSLSFLADKILDYELSQSITGIMPNQVLRYIPENQRERLIWQKALERDTEAFSLSYPQSLKKIIAEFIVQSQKLTLPIDGATPNRTRLAIQIRKGAECWNPFPKLSGVSDKRKDHRRKNSALICFLFMMIFHPETTAIFAERYYEVFSVSIPRIP
jgi:hypothetical protein